MKETLDALGCGARVHYVFAPGQAHSETFWRMRSPAIFDLFEDL
jgi:hypothetical protein